jgi:preprotein translocase subunit SecD
MQTAQQVMVSRVDKLGVASPNVAIQGGNEIVVQLAGIHDTNKAAKIIGSTGQLQFFDFEADLAPQSLNGSGQPRPIPTLYGLLKQLQDEAKKGTPEQYYLFGPRKVTKKVTTTVNGKEVTKKQTKTIKHAKLAGPDPQRHDLLLPYKGKQPAGTEILKVPAHREVVGSTSGHAWYVFKYFPTSPAHPNGPPEITGEDLNESGISADIASDTGQAEVLLSFKKHGAKEFQRITKLEYDRGRINAGRNGALGNNDPNTIVQYAGHNAIVLDGVLQSTPYIDYT